MGLRDSLRNALTPSRAKGEGTTEVGVSGESFITGFNDEEARSDNLSISDYRKMRQNDGTVAGLYNVITYPVQATTFDIHPDEKDRGEAELVSRNLLEPPHKGGMDLPMQLVIGSMLRGVLEGFALFEKVLTIEGNKIVYKKLAPRDSTTITLNRDDEGGYGGASQKATFKGKFVDVTIPAWKTFLFTFSKDKNFLYGESAFKAAHYHYRKKHKLYYISELQAQSRAIPPITAQPRTDTEWSNETRKKIQQGLSQLGRLRSTATLPYNLEMNELDLALPYEALPLIDHHNTEMARSILAQFLMLGTQKGSVGSWALSENHSDLFILALKGLMQNIENHINFYVIPDLVDLNFTNGAYPEFRFEDITSDARETLRTAFNELVKAGNISDALVKGVADRVAESLDIDVDAIQKDLDKEDKKRGAAKVAGSTPQEQEQTPKEVAQGDTHGHPFHSANGTGRSHPPNAAFSLHRSQRSSIS